MPQELPLTPLQKMLETAMRGKPSALEKLAWAGLIQDLPQNIAFLRKEG